MTSDQAPDQLPDQMTPVPDLVMTASPNSLGVSPVSGFPDIEPTTLLPRSLPIPHDYQCMAEPWIQVRLTHCDTEAILQSLSITNYHSVDVWGGSNWLPVHKV